MIRSGTRPVQEFSLTEATAEGDTLRGKAVWHEDVGDPGDSSEVLVMLRLTGESLELRTGRGAEKAGRVRHDCGQSARLWGRRAGCIVR